MQWNPNLTYLIDQFESGTRGVVLEGSSRSGKTWSGIDFIIYIAGHFPGSTVNIVRETYRSFKTTLYDDFNRRLPMWRLQSPFDGVQDRGSFWLNKTKINLLGADDPAKFHGAGCDFFFINEALDVPQTIFDQLEQRCRRFWWLDYNPKASDHWVYNQICDRPDVKMLRTTFQDNPNISQAERLKILSYDPSNPANVTNGTADDYMWKVYGLGHRSSPEGLVFPLVTYIERMPEGIERFLYGLDFGYTNDPTALIRIGVDGMNLYMEKLLYYPFDNAGSLAPFLNRSLPDQQHVWADSADPAMIADLRRMGLRVLAVRKFQGSIQFGIDVLKRYKLHIIQDQDFRREQENYKWREVNGIRLNEPVHQYCHLWDAARYAVISELRPNLA